MATLTIERSVLMTPRARLLAALTDALDARGVAWAFQGALDAPARWVLASGNADLDLWVAGPDRTAAAAVLADLGGARVVAADDPTRLRHESWWLDADGPAIVDLTVGDLRVGPVTLCDEAAVCTSRVDGLPFLAGAAAAMDRLVRPLLRGRVPDDARLLDARDAWRTADFAQRLRAMCTLHDGLGARLGADIADVLAGGPCPPGLPARCRRRLVRRTLAPRALRATVAQRGTILPTRRPGPVGLRTVGTLVVLVGTDGSGKSTVARDLTDALRTRGYRVHSAYFGMARGNLPGVTLARRLLGIRQETGEPVAPVEAEPSVAPTGPSAADAAPAPLSHTKVRRAAAWFYAGEYAWRWARHVAPGLARREVVICDRWVTDLRESPWPGSAASVFVERLVPSPDVLVLPDAPDALIHARKPERSAAEQARQQQVFRDLVAERPARIAEVVVDTSGTGPDVRRLVATTLTALHLPASTSGR